MTLLPITHKAPGVNAHVRLNSTPHVLPVQPPHLHYGLHQLVESARDTSVQGRSHDLQLRRSHISKLATPTWRDNLYKLANPVGSVAQVALASALFLSTNDEHRHHILNFLSRAIDFGVQGANATASSEDRIQELRLQIIQERLSQDHDLLRSLIQWLEQSQRDYYQAVSSIAH